MRCRLPALSPLLLALAACGGDSPTASWASPAEAAEAGAAALAAGDLEQAQSAYARAAEASDPVAKRDALAGLYQACLKGGRSAEAVAAAQRLAAETGAAADEVFLKGLADAAILERNAEVADAVIDLAVTKFPESKPSFAKAIAAVDALRTQGAGADLSALGYTGD